jgi:hypothetical protein
MIPIAITPDDEKRPDFLVGTPEIKIPAGIQSIGRAQNRRSPETQKKI